MFEQKISQYLCMWFGLPGSLSSIALNGHKQTDTSFQQHKGGVHGHTCVREVPQCRLWGSKSGAGTLGTLGSGHGNDNVTVGSMASPIPSLLHCGGGSKRSHHPGTSADTRVMYFPGITGALGRGNQQLKRPQEGCG